MKAKTWIVVLVAMMGVGMWCAGAMAERGGEGKTGDRPLAGPKADAPTSQPAGRRGGFTGDPGDRIKAAIREALEGVNPTDEQKTKIKGIMEDAHTKMEAWRKENDGKFK